MFPVERGVSRNKMKKNGLITTGFHLPYNPELRERAREMRSNMTIAEKKLWNEYLKGVGVTVLRQKPLDHYIVDFYCPKSKLVIEVDGEIHETEEAIENDSHRTAVLEGYGLKVLRFRNEEVFEEFDRVCREISRHIDE